ncbi:MAG TPA: hypothetical protein GYA07_05930 [Verrucomicrobia bacterium]|nr:hypothetical protein [Verrucomicrobiota bacterium]
MLPRSFVRDVTLHCCSKQLKKRVLSRRRFLSLGSIGLGGIAAGASDLLPARLLRGFIDERRRDVLAPKARPRPALWEPTRLSAAWLGHATVLINFQGVTILTDPALFNRIGADTLCGTIGPKRLIEPALTVDQLPPIDLVLLSHAHMDHLDPATLRRLPGRPQVVTARDMTDLIPANLPRPFELGWGETACVATAHGDLEIEAFEVNHWGSRWKYDRQRGYCGFVLSREKQRIIFGGDTAMTDSFARLRSKGPFDAAIMPVGAYNPWIFAHCSPEQAAAMADRAGAEFILPMHFATFPFGRESADEPMERLHAAVSPSRIGWSAVGETFFL